MKKTLVTLASMFTLFISFSFVPATAMADTEDEEFFEEDAVPEQEDISGTQTNYIGARLLKGQQNVNIGNLIAGPYDDTDTVRYKYWQGDTLFAGVTDPESNNKVDLIAEFYWFESSIWRNADFYVVVIKVKTSPNPADDWFIKEANGWWTDLLNATDTAQLVEVDMDPTGVNGAVRWDWCVPFDSYKWEPEKTIEVESGYSAGVDAEGGFSEGGILKDLTDKSNIQAKGYVSAKHKVSTHYTITMYKWQVYVSSGGSNMKWQTRILPGGNNEDTSYQEYFLVLQAEKGTEVKLDSLAFGGGFKKSYWYWFDGYKGISAALTDITFSPPAGCYLDDPIPADVCPVDGVCKDAVGFCDPDAGEFICALPQSFEEVEVSCDGLDNNCDGIIDEEWEDLGEACDGDDLDNKSDGKWACNAQKNGIVCDEDPCNNMECGDGCGECEGDLSCVDGECIELLNAKADGCGNITTEGTCNGDTLMYCNGTEVVEVVCQTCCGYNSDAGYFACLAPLYCEAEDNEPAACVPNCADKECGGDGCGGTCGACESDEICSWEGECIELAVEEEPGCEFCPPGTYCSEDGDCIEPDMTGGYEAGDEMAGAENTGCTAAPRTTGSAANFLLLALVALALLGFRRMTVK